MELFIILKDIILPIFIVMAIGYILQKKFNMDISTLSKLNIYFVVPAFIFVKLYSTKISFSLFGYVFLFFILLVFILFMISIVVAKFLKLDKSKKTTFSNSVIFFNSGNYGVPVNDLVFKSDPFAASIQVIVLTLQNIFTFSYGIFSMQSVEKGKWNALLGYFKMPVLYAMLAGVILNAFHVDIPSFIWLPANYIADAMIALALLTLGAQVARIQFRSGLSSVYSSLIVRLIISPVVALIIIWVFQVEGVIAQALFIASAMPTSVNSAVIAQEYKNHPEFAAQVVLFSTILSAATVSLVIYFSGILF
ncbi:AEC family transporter [Oceanobacillus sp. Castelsardo]|uniref:AEC family transporter n=1 Tax=Oceanobacillus sp. Castelsardo TaxID=1851204 RepID=UPI000A9B4DA3|nr:AEC family transporter [Oceanobacillus sp. Castelsardo]